MRLIDADALTKKLQHLWNIHDDVDFNNKDVWHELENAPTIDAVEVVRCGNCTYAETATGWLSGFLWCVKDFETGCGQKMAKKKDGYCSFGERRTDG